MSRVLCWFSCGAASAIAAKLTLVKHPEAEVIYCLVKEEHPDNLRFLADCQRWLGKEITILTNEKYGGSVDAVIRGTRFLTGPSGARCTTELKKKLRIDYQRPGDLQVFGYTSEEQDRADRFIDSNPDVRLLTPLIDADLSKADCLGLLTRAGIELPAMYRLGFANANCIGCVKGGQNYWMAIRRHFPERFGEMASIERWLGRTVLRRNGEPLWLDELPPGDGDMTLDQPASCGIACEYTETKEAMKSRAL